MPRIKAKSPHIGGPCKSDSKSDLSDWSYFNTQINPIDPAKITASSIDAATTIPTRSAPLDVIFPSTFSALLIKSNNVLPSTGLEGCN